MVKTLLLCSNSILTTNLANLFGKELVFTLAIEHHLLLIIQDLF